MMRRSILKARKATLSKCHLAANSNFIQNPTQVHSIDHSFASSFSTLCPVRVLFYPRTRLFSSDWSKAMEEPEPPVFADDVFDENPRIKTSSYVEGNSESRDWSKEMEKDEPPIFADHVFDESPSKAFSSEFVEKRETSDWSKEMGKDEPNVFADLVFDESASKKSSYEFVEKSKSSDWSKGMGKDEPPNFAGHVSDGSASKTFSSAFVENKEISENLASECFVSGEAETLLNVDEDEESHGSGLEKLESIVSLLQSSSGADAAIVSSLGKMKLKLDDEFVVKLLETPDIPGKNLIGFFKWVMTKPEFSMTTSSLHALVKTICSELKGKNVYAVWDLVKEISNKEIGIVNAEILNELISVFSRIGRGKAGFEVFSKFDDMGCVPNSDTYYFTIEGLCRRSIRDFLGSVCQKMIDNGKLPDKEKTGKIISLLCKCSEAKEAHAVYTAMKIKKNYPPQSSFNHLVSSLCNDDKTVDLAFEMLQDIPDEDRRNAIMPYSYVIRGLCRTNAVEKAKNLLHKMMDEGPPPGNAVFNSVINGLSKSGDLEDARRMVKAMENRGLKPDVYTYTVVMSGYVTGGEMEKAIEVLDETKKRHSKLSPVTYHTLVRGYCKLEEFDKAVELLSEMKTFGVNPTADEYSKLIRSICIKDLDYETAERLRNEMYENGLHLNGVTKALVNAVRELVEEAKGSAVEA